MRGSKTFVKSSAVGIKLGLEIACCYGIGCILIKVLLLQVFIVEIIIQILLIVYPTTDLMGVLFVIMSGSGSVLKQNVLAIVANMISLESIIAPKDHLTPQVGVLSRFVHGGVGLEVLFNKEFIFLNH